MNGKYAPLLAHLAAHEGAEVSLTFAEIEAIMDGPLPQSAYVLPEYWAGRKFAHTQALSALGWRGRIDRPHGRVRFTRDAETKTR